MKTMPSEIGFPMTFTTGAFVNIKRNKQTSHELRTILLAAVFHFVHQVENDSLKHHKMTQNSQSLSAPAISKQVSRRCINFPPELTCQILTNQNIKIGQRAGSTRDSEKSQKRLPSLHVKAG